MIILILICLYYYFNSYILIDPSFDYIFIDPSFDHLQERFVVVVPGR